MLVYLYWLIFIIVSISALRNFKATVLVWLPLSWTCNNMECLKFSHPILPLSTAVSFTLFFIYLTKIRGNNLKYGLNSRPFMLKGVFKLYFLSYLMSIVFSIAPLSTVFTGTIRFFMENLALLFLFYKCFNDEKDIRIFVGACLFVAFFSGFWGFSEFLLKDNYFKAFQYFNSPLEPEEMAERDWYYTPAYLVTGEGDMRFGIARCSSIFNIHISYGIVSMFIFYMLYVLTRDKFVINIKQRWIKLAMWIALAGVFLCNSKTGMIGLVIVILGLYNFKKLLNLKVIIAFAFVIIVLTCFFPGYVLTFLSLFDSKLAAEGGGSSVKLRQMQFEIGMRLFAESPLFGNGVGSMSILREVGNNADILGAESSWLKILPERGALGAFAYIYFYYAMFTNGVKVIPRRQLFFLLAGIGVMETATGLFPMSEIGAVFVFLYRYYQLRKISLAHYKKKNKRKINESKSIDISANIWRREIYRTMRHKLV